MKRSYDMMCQAVDLIKKSAAFYSKSINDCPEALGREVFESLLKDKQEQKQLAETISLGLSQGQPWEAVCKLDDSAPSDASKLFDKLSAEKKPESKVCFTMLGALNLAIESELAALNLFKQNRELATDKAEQKFLDKMIQEQRTGYSLLSDARNYYEDPEGWFMQQESPTLDGA